MPGRTAFIDECGNFGFRFEREGTSKYYIICAVVAQNSELQYLHRVVSEVKNNNGFRDAEMKSSAIDNYKRRNKILAELLTVKFNVVLLVADKQAFIEKSPLTLYQQTFIKYLHNKLYNVLYCVYPKLKIIEDEIGTSEFQESFKKYVWEKSPRNLFNDYDFGYIDSKDSLLVQLADFVGGTISKVYTDDSAPNYLEMLKGKILHVEKFPNTSTPYFGTASEEDRKYDKDIFDLAIHRARTFIEKYECDGDPDRHLQIALLKHLMFQVHDVDAHKYVSSYQLLPLLNEYTGQRIRPNYLYRRVIAPLRDSEVILASCTQGYKIPISVEDITTYLNQTHMIVSPMLNRIKKCRNLIKKQTNNTLDVLDDPAFLKYKKYFD
jgi:hypothetical protein